MKNFNEQMEDLNEKYIKLENENTFLKAEHKREREAMKIEILRLRQEIVELKHKSKDSYSKPLLHKPNRNA